MKLINKQIVSLPSDDKKFTYIVRYMPWFTSRVMVNFIYGDSGVLHSHPWSYFTFILWGGYKETIIKDVCILIKFCGEKKKIKKLYFQNFHIQSFINSFHSILFEL